ncbi:fumarylacetoacetate hydrolase family protein [Actibacterium sp. MT2.3-13A]|uniref:fumarylacetoacetate hydrolase family protein n=1 Tax=Actibacterium sp. MT2.3-13A TaxID=2828332 RepID=UPI001BAD257A|nr:fumarylacetoacetate hydrolase family protein [Actibacterium sp. MT2.3-13A]
MYVIPAPAQPALPVAGETAQFPVRRIFCVGRNYAEHIREMGNDTREPPFFFTKPADALVAGDARIPFPPATSDLHHEAELVVAIGRGGQDIAPGDALDHVWGYAAGNDLTRRDLQAQAKSMRRPWDMAKAFDNSAICGPLHPVSRVGHPATGRITARVNGELRQDGDLSEMIWPVADVIAHLSGLVALAPGDLIYTGTPAGVGALSRGDRCTVEIEGLGAVTTEFA